MRPPFGFGPGSRVLRQQQARSMQEVAARAGAGREQEDPIVELAESWNG